MQKQNEHLKLQFHGLTNIGKVRAINEDGLMIMVNGKTDIEFDDAPLSIYPEKGFVAIVTDGMGGSEAGEIAAELAIQTGITQINQLDHWPHNEKAIRESMVSILLGAHFKIVNHALENPETSGMGTTIAFALFIDNSVHIAWCGDTRIYRYNPNLKSKHKPYESQHLRICSNDHSLVWDKVLKGKLTAEQARVHPNSNVITQSLGNPDSIPRIDTLSFPLMEGDKWLICTDGLNSMLSDAALEGILSETDVPSVQNNKLIQAALDAGGIDNVTSVLVRVDQVPLVVDNSEPDSILHEPALKSRPEMVTKAHYSDSDEYDVNNSGYRGLSNPYLKWILIILTIVGIGIMIYKLKKTLQDKDKIEIKSKNYNVWFNESNRFGDFYNENDNDRLPGIQSNNISSQKSENKKSGKKDSLINNLTKPPLDTVTDGPSSGNKQ